MDIIVFQLFESILRVSSHSLSVGMWYPVAHTPFIRILSPEVAVANVPAEALVVAPPQRLLLGVISQSPELRIKLLVKSVDTGPVMVVAAIVISLLRPH